MDKQRTLRTSCLGSLMLAGILMTGCAVNETATVTKDADGSTQQVIVSNSGFLSANLRIAESKMGKVGDLLRVQATIENQSGGDLTFQYKFKWLDKDGFEVAVDGRPWQPISITGYESKSVQAVAPNPTATSFQILVQD